MIINPSEEEILEDGWVLFVEPELSQEEIFNNQKNLLIDQVLHYDSSSYVNEFYIQDIPVWLDKTTRTGLKLRFEAELATGKTDTSLWYNNMQFPLELNNAIQMLYALEIYASQCYDNTQWHLANINTLTTIEELEAYDYTSGYPEKLRF